MLLGLVAQYSPRISSRTLATPGQAGSCRCSSLYHPEICGNEYQQFFRLQKLLQTQRTVFLRIQSVRQQRIIVVRMHACIPSPTPPAPPLSSQGCGGLGVVHCWFLPFCWYVQFRTSRFTCICLLAIHKSPNSPQVEPILSRGSSCHAEQLVAGACAASVFVRPGLGVSPQRN